MVRASFYAFISSSAYLFLKRLYLKELLGWFLYIIFAVITSMMEITLSMFGTIDIGRVVVEWVIDRDGMGRGVVSSPISAFGGESSIGLM
jgi:hypothetical protein